jgi:4-amino-4-deoxy-L-arabinose transferase-like glycosyltransferase
MPVVPAVAALIVALALVWDANRFFFKPTAALLNSLDEGYATAFGRRMVEGRWLPYVDAVSHRGPVYYWVTAVLVKTCGWSSWLAMRVGTLSCMLLSTC